MPELGWKRASKRCRQALVQLSVCFARARIVHSREDDVLLGELQQTLVVAYLIGRADSAMIHRAAPRAASVAVSSTRARCETDFGRRQWTTRRPISAATPPIDLLLQRAANILRLRRRSCKMRRSSDATRSQLRLNRLSEMRARMDAPRSSVKSATPRSRSRLCIAYIISNHRYCRPRWPRGVNLDDTEKGRASSAHTINGLQGAALTAGIPVIVSRVILYRRPELGCIEVSVIDTARQF